MFLLRSLNFSCIKQVVCVSQIRNVSIKKTQGVKILPDIPVRELIRYKPKVDLNLVESFEKIRKKLNLKAFNFFFMEKFKEYNEETNDKKPITAFSKRISDDWRSISYDEKIGFYERAKKNYEMYRTEIDNLVAHLTENELKSLEEELRNRRRLRNKLREKINLRREKLKLGIPRRPIGALFTFGKTLDFSNIPFSERGRVLKEKWNELTEQEKTNYKNEANVDLNEYYKKKIDWEIKMITNGRRDLVSAKTQRDLAKNIEKEMNKVKPKDPEHIERPRNRHRLASVPPFSLFISELMLKKKFKFREAAIEGSKLWKTMDEKKKNKYFKEAEELRNEFQQLKNKKLN
ncbi:unnamed protein product [Brachionus calyciflorus]|uniref:HMG box domain-containing protein n=1 Tax=Brachionus calyciflorus TaxID=104777 RepID=A0A813TMG4_9BILA|nr:unnamed protein product [Brachionus calyciflorus]